MGSEAKIVLSGAPGTGKSTVGRVVSADLGIPFVSLDVMKEALADVLGPGGEEWSNQLGDAAAEILFGMCAEFPTVVAEGWWRRDRRERALKEFAGWVEVFCRCEPELAEQRMRARIEAGRHPIHRDVINPGVHLQVADLVRATEPLSVGRALIEIDTTHGFAEDALLQQVRAALQ